MELTGFSAFPTTFAHWTRFTSGSTGAPCCWRWRPRSSASCWAFQSPTSSLNSHRLGLRNLLLFLVTLPFWTSFLIRTYAWILLLRTEGIINNALLALGIIQQPLPLLYNNFAILAGLAYAELPFMILPLYTALERIDKSQMEASSDLGCTPGKPSGGFLFL